MKKGDKKPQAPDPLKKKTFQGLILAENFSAQKNYCLVPAPVENSLEKAIQSLEKAKVEEILVFASSSKDPIMAYLATRGPKKVPLRFIHSPECLSLGDCLRAVHALKVVNQPFVLLFADVLSELSLSPLIELFEERLEKLKPLLMLKLFAEKEPNAPAKQNESSLVVFDKGKMLLKLFEPLQPSGKRLISIKENARFSFKQIFEEPVSAEKLHLATNLSDAGISICSLELLSYFSENFDFHSERDHFLKDLLGSEINDDHVSLEILDRAIFHKRAISPFELFRASNLAIKNCSSRFYISKEEYLFSRFNRIISKKSKIGIRAQIGNHVFIGENVQIGEDAVIENSIILPGSKIGDNVKLADCFLGQNSQVECDCSLKRVFSPFALNFRERGAKLENATFDGQAWEFLQFEAEEETFADNEEPRFEFDENPGGVQADFREEVRETVAKIAEDFSNMESAVTELVNIRLAENRSHVEMADCVLRAILATSKIDKENVLGGIKNLAGWGPVLKKFIIGDEEMRRGVQICEEVSNENPLLKFHLLIQVLYQIEVLRDGLVIEWFEERKKSGDCKDLQKAALLEKFVEWLKSADAEDEEDEGEEEKGEEEMQE